jgi:hypothetical protein
MIPPGEQGVHCEETRGDMIPLGSQGDQGLHCEETEVI